MQETEFREVLIFVAGTTPQIVTETLYALIHNDPPVYPDEIHIITTSYGKELIEKNLIASGRLREFCREFHLSEEILNTDSILVVKGNNNVSLADIKEAPDNEALGDFITNFIRFKTSDEKARLHCSLTGGRKTMSFYLGSALQLFGRPWDKLYHVLITPEFESNPDFYYKPKKDRVLKRNGRELHTKDVQIFLAELPFIRLREKLPLNGKNFKGLVEEGQKEIDTALSQPHVNISLMDRLVTIGNQSIEFKPFHLVFYVHLLKQKTGHCLYPERAYCHNCTDCFLQLNDLTTPRVKNIIAKDYEIIYGQHSGHVENFHMQWKDGIDISKLRSDRSKINRDIIESLKDDTLATYYTITSLRKYGNTRFGIKVEKGKIRVE